MARVHFTCFQSMSTSRKDIGMRTPIRTSVIFIIRRENNILKLKRIFAFTLITGRYLWGICLVCTMLSPCVDIYNLIISLYKCHNFMLRLSIHILEIITYYRQGKNMINISHSFFTLSVLITVLFVMISYLFYYWIMTDMAKTYISAGHYQRAGQHYSIHSKPC